MAPRVAEAPAATRFGGGGAPASSGGGGGGGRGGGEEAAKEEEGVGVDAFLGQYTIALDRVVSSDASCSAAAPTGQTGMVDRSDRSRRGSPTRIQRTPTRVELRRGKRTLGCPRLGRPARAPPHAMEMREEQHIGLKKIRAKRKVKK